MQKTIALDLEGVLIPEIWKEVAKITNIEQLGLTTRDISDYDQLMEIRIKALQKHAITIHTLQDIIATMTPLPDALDFFMHLRKHCEVIIVSDTFVEFFTPFRALLQYPVIFCNSLVIDTQGNIQSYILRQHNGKFHLTKQLQACNIFVAAAGDSYNDITMIQQANYGAFFRAPQTITDLYPSIPAFEHYEALSQALLTCK